MNFHKSFSRNLMTGIYVAITAMVIAKFLNALTDQGSFGSLSAISIWRQRLQEP